MKAILRNILRNANRLKTPLVLVVAWALYWGVADTLSAVALLVGFTACAMVLAFVVSKEIFSSYRWNVGERLRAAWDGRDLAQSVLAASMLFARVLVYAAVMLAMAVTLLFLKGGL